MLDDSVSFSAEHEFDHVQAILARYSRARVVVRELTFSHRGLSIDVWFQGDRQCLRIECLAPSYMSAFMRGIVGEFELKRVDESRFELVDPTNGMRVICADVRARMVEAAVWQSDLLPE